MLACDTDLFANKSLDSVSSNVVKNSWGHTFIFSGKIIKAFYALILFLVITLKNQISIAGYMFFYALPFYFQLH